MPVHEDVTAAFAEARPILADAFHPDDYEIERRVRVSDGSGGYTTESQIVESGKCALNAANRIGTEGASGPLTLAITSYMVELPIDTALAPEDTLYVNGRKFGVTSVMKGGDHEVFVTAQIEEVI